MCAGRLCHTLLQPHQSYRCEVSSADPPPCPPTAQQSWLCVRVYFVCLDYRQDLAAAKTFYGRNRFLTLISLKTKSYLTLNCLHFGCKKYGLVELSQLMCKYFLGWGVRAQSWLFYQDWDLLVIIRDQHLIALFHLFLNKTLLATLLPWLMMCSVSLTN